MATQFSSIQSKDLGAGTDQLSPETSIPEGYSERLVNFDPKAEGYLAKRPGYVGYAGNLPVRVTRLDYTDDATSNICFTLDRAVDFSSTRSSPLVAFGRTSSTHVDGGEWNSTDSAHYYPGFSPRIKKSFPALSTTTVNILASEHGQASASMLVGLASSSSFVDNSNVVIFPDALSINTSTYEISITADNETASDVDAFVYYLGQDAVSGSIFNTPVPLAISAGTSTTTITQLTHLLSSNHIQARVYSVSGGSRSLILPDEIRVLNNGDVEIDITTLNPLSIFVILSIAPLANTFSTSLVPSNTAQTVTFPIESAFIFPVVYRENGTTLEEVYADSVSIDAVALEATLSFTNDAGSATFQIFWQYGIITSNTICVDGTVIGASRASDFLPQLTLWGLDHSSLYSAGGRGGWANHIDTYRVAGDQRVVAGLGGNLFAARTYAEVGTSFLLPLAYPNLRHRISGLQYIGPAFWATGDTVLRSRGYITTPSAASHVVSAPSIAYDAGNDWVVYTLSLPSMVINGTLGTIISNDDYLTITGAGSARLNGVFKIANVTQPNASTLTISVENAAVDGNDWDETDSGALAGIFTDKVTLSTNSSFLDGDVILAEVFADDEVVTVTSSASTSVVLSGLIQEYALGNNLVISGSRTSSVMPLRTLTGTADVTNFVPGDMLEITNLTRQVRIASINSDIERNVSITSVSGIASVTLLTGDTNVLTPGQKVLLLRSGIFSGVVTVSTIDSLSTFSFETDEEDATVSGTLAGKTITLDEELAWQDTTTSSISLVVPARWIPIEAPDDSFNLTPSTTPFHFNSNDYDDQSILRSTMSADNLYLSQGEDEVMKFDGASLYRAGLPRWQPQLFLTTDTTGAGNIVINTPSSTVTATSGLKFTIALADKALFSIGDEIQYSIDNSEYTIVAIEDDGTNTYVRVNKTITGVFAGTPTIRGILNAKYYMRLNSVDSNNNIIASAITGADDNVARLSVDGKVRLRLVGLPVLGAFDYSRLEVEIYRTKFARGFDASTLGVFYHVATLPLPFNNNDGYLDYVDTDSDIVLRDADPTASLTGAELGTTFSQPLRASSITSAGNRVVLGNIKDYPRVNLQMNQTGTLLTAANLAPLTWLLRRDNTDTLTTTNMVDRVGFDWVSSGSLTIDYSVPSTAIVSTSTDFTVKTTTPHGQVAGNWVYLYRSTVLNGLLLRYAGWYQIATVPLTTTFTVLDSANAGASGAFDVDRVAVAVAAGNVPVWLGVDGNYGMYNGNTDSSLSYLFTATRRLANAINASMRKCTTTGFSPWVVASAGNEFASGQLILEQPFAASTNLEVKLPAFTNFTVFGNGVSRVAGSEVGSQTALFPSRILISYQNYAELFDNPTAINDSDSASAIDVNSADGQEVVTCIPFFGDSAFGSAQKSGIVVVFKTNSIYIVDLAAKAAGQNAVQRIESQGLGCTAPGSVTVTRDGILFANDSGIFKLTKSLTVDYLGKRLERIWRGEVNRTLLALAAGHHFNAGSQYKLSVPMLASDDTSPSQAFVYDHTRELRADGYGQGSWTEHSNHPALGWCNLGPQAFWASANGRIFAIRQAGDVTDHRDDNAAIGASATLRAMDFGDSSIRKSVGDVIVYYRTNNNATESVVVSSAADLEDSFDPLDDSSVKATTKVSNGLSGTAFRKVVGIRYSLFKKRLFFVQLKIESNEIDQPCEIASVLYRVAGMSSATATEAKDTTS